MNSTTITAPALPLPVGYWPPCSACDSTGRITQRTKAFAGGPVRIHQRDCALCLGTGRSPWPRP